MKVTILLADYAQEINGKLYVMGGGWSITNSGPGPMAIAVKIEVPWNQANRKHDFDLSLLDSDGQPMVSAEDQPITMSGEFEVGRPPGLIAGSPIDFAMAVNVQRGPLSPNSRFVWQLMLDGTSEPDWHVAFTTGPE